MSAASIGESELRPAPIGLRRWLWPVLVAAVLLAVIAAFSLGRFGVPPETVMRILLAQILPIAPDWTTVQEQVVVSVRGPRVLAALVCGAGLALSGAALQGVFRNPLVGPDLLGVSSAAAFGGALAILFAGGGAALLACAFLGGMAALVLVFALARVDGATSTVALILVGLVVGALFTALVSLLTYIADPEDELPTIVYWLLGTFGAVSPQRLLPTALVIAVAGFVLLLLRYRLNLLSLGDDEARALGVPVERTRWLILAAVAAITAATVAIAGIIGWVGLVVPHLARLLVGPDHRRLLPAAALLGGAYLVIVDTIARAASAQDLPLGILTALIGAPLFILLLRRRLHDASSGG
jgi:iron complex transport system permease protein